MAISPTGKWSYSDQGSVPNRDFYSGKRTVSNTTYNTAQKFEFGFSAATIHIRNPSATELVFQFLSREGEVIDNGTVPPASTDPIEMVLREANKEGILLRVEGGSAANVEVIAYG